MIRVSVNPGVLRWARERAGPAQEKLVRKFKALPDWESGRKQPTLKQLEDFARAAHVPIGHLFGTKPPDEPVPIPDFRTLSGQKVARPTPNLLDTIYTCQERQDWYRDAMRAADAETLEFVGSATAGESPRAVAENMRHVLRFGLADQRECQDWNEALRRFIGHADEAGVLVMVSGVVLNNNSRPLDPEEFRGFALSDPLAPLVFINGKDAKAAQMFTLAHELAHIWLGSTALSNAGVGPRRTRRAEEVWCNRVAAEFLVPMDALQNALQPDEPLQDATARLANLFKASRLVILRRLLDAGWLSRSQFESAWVEERERLRAIPRKGGGGGNFYRTAVARVGRRFARELVVSTLEGETLYRDAFRMLGIRSGESLNRVGLEVGILE